ncbi:MAG: hypothetical protein GF320_14305 [Armatimonadia bacterium]|nr:hypothetical protein [Armatimonadia bacterium]
MQLLEIIPEEWTECLDTKDTQLAECRPWLEAHSRGILRLLPDLPETICHVASVFRVSWKLLVLRMQLEQSAITYAWDDSLRQYDPTQEQAALRGWDWRAVKARGASQHDLVKLGYLCGADKTGEGPRPDGWFGPQLQLAGCADRFACSYAGMALPRHAQRELALPVRPADVRHLTPSWEVRAPQQGVPEGFAPGKPVTRQGITVIPSNQASADCLRYTASMSAQRRMAERGRLWWPGDYGSDPPVPVITKRLIWLDPGHGCRKRDGSLDTGTADTSGLHTGLAEKDVVMAVARRLKEMLEASGLFEVRLTHQRSDYSERMNYSDRGAKAADTGYECYISLHLDSASDKRVHGTTVFVPKVPRSSPKSRRLAKALATELLAEFGRGVSYADARPEGVMPHWYNLGTFVGGDNNFSSGALALPEPLFMSNLEDMRIISSPGFPERYAGAVYRGVLEYCQLTDVPAPEPGPEPDPDPIDEQDPEPPPPEPDQPSWSEDELAWAEAEGISDCTDLDRPATRREVITIAGRTAAWVLDWIRSERR